MSALRSAVLWLLAWIFFLAGGLVVLVLLLLLGPHRTAALCKLFCRIEVTLAGARLRTVRAPGFSADATYVFVSNHVNLFDPFVICATFPQYTRGLELASHFKIPLYGWLIRRMGNVPVPDRKGAAELTRTWKRARDALAGGTSLMIFPEGSRTRDGSVGPFRLGAFRMARQFERPLVPVTLEGSFRHKRVGSWILRPTTITVHFHEPIDLQGVTREQLPALRDRVREEIAGALKPR